MFLVLKRIVSFEYQQHMFRSRNKEIILELPHLYLKANMQCNVIRYSDRLFLRSISLFKFFVKDSGSVGRALSC